ncbi:MAG: adenylate/guanylate cyclase domain-containing protein [Bacteroidia bacterium]
MMRKKILLCLLFCLHLLQQAAAQQSKVVDSLSSRLKLTLHDTGRVNTLNALAFELSKINPDTSALLTTQALALAEKIKFEKGIGNANNNLGLLNYLKHDYPKSLACYEKALAIWEKLEKQTEPADKYYIITNKSTTLGRMGSVFLVQTDYPKALDYYFKALKIDEAAGNNNGVARHLGNIGIIYKEQSDFPKALEYYFKALKIDEELGNKIAIARHTGNIGNVYMEQANYSKALDYFFKALKIDEEMDNQRGVALHLGNIGIIYKAQSDYPKALEYYFKALAIRERLDDKRGIAIIYGNIGNVYKEQADYPRALDYFFKSLKIKQELGDKKGIGIVLGNIGNVYHEQANYSNALDYYSKALKMDEALDEKTGIAVQLCNIGSVYTQTGKFKEAEYHLKKGLALCDSIGYLEGKKDNEKIISHLYDTLATLIETGKPLKGFENLAELRKLAFEHYKKHIAARDTINSEEQQKKQVRLEMNYEFEKKEAAAKAEQEKKDAFTQAELRKQKIIRNAIGGGLAIVLLFSTVVYRQRNRISKEKKRSEELLLNILPEEVADELKAKGEAEAKLIDEATVLFTDFKGFTAMSEKVSPKQLVRDLHECFSAFDLIMQKYGLEKIKTIGDSYMAAGGLPTPNTTHATDAVKAALEMIAFVEEGKQRKLAAGLPYFEIRIGIHTGPVVAGIVGVKKFQYDIWGDTVNTASRMESSGEVGKINISETTCALVKDTFNCTHRGKITAKGKGEIDMYFVNA